MPIFPIYALIITQLLDFKTNHQFKIFSFLIILLLTNLFFTIPEHYLTQIKHVPDNGIIITSQAAGSIFFIDNQCLINIPNDDIDINSFNDFYKIGIRKPY